MTDAELADFIGITDYTPEIQAKFIAALSLEERATFERMSQVTHEINLWQAGLGPKPQGVIVCHEHKRRTGAARRG